MWLSFGKIFHNYNLHTGACMLSRTLDGGLGAEFAAPTIGPLPVDSPASATAGLGSIINVTTDGNSVTGQEPFDTINDPTNSNDTITTYQQGDSHAQVNVGTGTGNTVIAHTFDTINFNAPNGTIEEFQGHDNVFNLGNGDYNATLGSNDTVTAGNGRSLYQFSAGATNDTITVGNGPNNINAAKGDGNFVVSVGTGINWVGFYQMTGGSLKVSQAAGAAPDVIDVDNSTLTSLTATIANRGDAVVSFDSNIASMTLYVATDGYKPPYGATVYYIGTGEAIAAPYNEAAALPYFISDLLFDPVPHWSYTVGKQATAPTITFSFMQSVPQYASAHDANGFAPLGPDLPAGYTPQQLLTANSNNTIVLNAAELSAVTALAAWETVANINLVSVADSGAAEIRIGSNSQGTSSSAYSYVPLVPAAPYYGTSDTASDNYSESGDVYINKDLITAGYFTPSGFGSHALVHEIGHALGLGGESGATDPQDVLPGDQDSSLNTVMSFYGPANIDTPQVFDIAVIQYLYGPNPNYHPNPSHVWTFSAAGGANNLVSDGGGSINTITAAGTTAPAYIDLRPGHWDYVGSLSSNILDPFQMMIDYGTLVTNVIAGDGSATIVCNDNGDTVTCGAGADTVIVGPGSNSIFGSGNGVDTAVFETASSAYTITVKTDGGITVSSMQGAIAPTNLLNVQFLQFTDKLVFDVSPAQAQVALLYQGALGRQPDPAGLSGWEKAFFSESAAQQNADLFTSLAGTAVAGLPDIANGFTHSTEFQQKYGSLTDTQFVSQLYANVLDRAPDSAGLNAWVQAMSNGHTRDWVLVGFVESAEALHNAEVGYVGQTGIQHAAWLVVT